MNKLIAKFRASQTAKDALRLLAYLDKHPFAECLLPCGSGDHLLVSQLREKRARALHAVHSARAA